MMWKQGAVYALKDSGNEDELGNPIKEQSVLWSGDLRFTPWTNDDITVNGREMTMNEQRYAVPVPYEAIKNAEQVELDGVMLDVTSISDFGPRWTMIQVRVYRQ